MKKIVYIIILMTCSSVQNKIIAQATSASPLADPAPNQPNTPGVDYVGWDNTVTVPLDIKHENTQPINLIWYSSDAWFV